MASLPEALALALQHHQSGRMGAAGQLYRRILALAPDHADAVHLMGLVIRRSAGREAVAADLMRRALRLEPAMAAAHHNLGNLLRDGGRAGDAAASLRRAIALVPESVEAYQSLAMVGVAGGADPAGLHRRMIQLRPAWPEAHNGLANSHQEGGRLQDAVAAYRRALALDPAMSTAWSNVGIALRALGRMEETLAAHTRAVRLAPSFAPALTSLGLTLNDLGHSEEAARCHRRAVAIDPAFPGAICNLGTARLALNGVDDAIRCYRRAVRVEPQGADGHRNLGMALLVGGELGEGWNEYEWRLRCKDAPTQGEIPRPRWNGEPLNGRTILLHSEQGLGDAIQFSRYAPMVAARGGKVLLGTPASLAPLLRPIPGVEDVVSGTLSLNSFDVQVPLLSLPQVFGTTLDAVPAAVPYLHPQPGAVSGWAERLAEERGLRIGIVWAGSPGHANDRNRSLPLGAFAPLARVPGVTLFSIQKGPTEGQAAAPPDGMRLVNLSPHISSFLDTAAIIANLDLVVCVDTSVAHLAGAMGRPVWVLLPFAPDWRWLIDREDTPWYPTMRLFRQTRPGDWSDTLDRLAAAVARLV